MHTQAWTSYPGWLKNKQKFTIFSSDCPCRSYDKIMFVGASLLAQFRQATGTRWTKSPTNSPWPLRPRVATAVTDFLPQKHCFRVSLHRWFCIQAFNSRGWTAAFCNFDPSNRGTTGINLLSQVPEVSVLCVPNGCSCVVCKNILEFYVNLIMSTVNNLQFLVAYFGKLPPYLQFLISYNLNFSKITINPSIVLKQHKIYPHRWAPDPASMLQTTFRWTYPMFFVD